MCTHSYQRPRKPRNRPGYAKPTVGLHASQTAIGIADKTPFSATFSGDEGLARQKNTHFRPCSGAGPVREKRRAFSANFGGDEARTQQDTRFFGHLWRGTRCIAIKSPLFRSRSSRPQLFIVHLTGQSSPKSVTAQFYRLSHGRRSNRSPLSGNDWHRLHELALFMLHQM